MSKSRGDELEQVKQELKTVRSELKLANAAEATANGREQAALARIKTLEAAAAKPAANKAFLAGIAQLDKLTDQLADEREENRRLRENLRRSQSLLQQLAPLCIQVAEVAGQKDLFE